MEKMRDSLFTRPIIVRGGGDLATGVIQKLCHAGFKVLVLEVATPLAIRRTVALCTAVNEQKYQVEDIVAVHIDTIEECETCWDNNEVPILVDPSGRSIEQLQPVAVIDAILAKKNLGTSSAMAPIVVAMGPGFSAPEDCHCVIETMRGHQLGRLIFSGATLPNTGIPGEIGGKSAERVVHSPDSGIVKHYRAIGDIVEKNDLLFYVGETPVYSPLSGVLRGLISNGLEISKGLKCADVDPRDASVVDCFTISDKARALGGAVLDALFYLANQQDSMA